MADGQGKPTIVLIHGLWMTPLSWEHWVERYTAAGYKVETPAWPGFDRPVDEIRAETLIVMQEGAGVRQMVEDELRGIGVRLRDLDVRLELGLQESVITAVKAG